ncbi:glycosyltransferase [Chloroflexota bacterium]
MAESKEGIRVLYVCPWAHLAGHWPHIAIKETTALLKAGVVVSLCTFRGILDEKEPPAIPHRKVLSGWSSFPLDVLIRSLNFIPKGRIIARLLEAIATLFLAVKLKSSLRYHVLYLREGDPYIFLPFLFGLFLKDYRWVVFLIGVMRRMDYKFSTSPIWKPIYRRSLSRNRYAFICQNSYVEDSFQRGFLDGILSETMTSVLFAAEETSSYIPQEEARQYLSLPQGKVILLHFGVLHPGKDIKTVLAAIRDTPDVLLIHAGKVKSTVYLKGLVRHYGLQNRVIIKGYYIPEAEKPYYFASADGVILSYKKDFMRTASMLWETASFRVPAIASDSGELGELVNRCQTGLVFKAEDATSLKETLSHFLTLSQSQKKTMISNCEKFCDEFSLDGWAQKCQEIFKGLCG